MAKYGMSMCTLGMSSEFKKYNIAVNSLWTKTAINTAAIQMLGGFVTPEQCRKPEIVSEAAYVILSKNLEKQKSSQYGGFLLLQHYIKKPILKSFKYEFIQKNQSVMDDYTVFVLTCSKTFFIWVAGVL